MKLEARTTSNAEVSAQYGGNYRYTVVNDRTVLIDPSPRWRPASEWAA